MGFTALIPSYISLVSVVSLLLVIHATIVMSKLAPALYVFGDSLSDSGNNNFLQTQVKANYSPYGIDFPGVRATGRFTNGRNIVDYIAKWLLLPHAPAYLSLSDDERANITTGLNYASSAAGILRESGTATGDVLSLDEQVSYFRKTATNNLPKLFSSPTELSRYLSKSIFSISIGSNDYVNNYLQSTIYNSSKMYTPEQFGEHLTSELRKQLKILYSLGARKFLVFEIGPVGCIPAIVNSSYSRYPKPTSPCIESVNYLVKNYNKRLPKTIKILSSTLRNSTFVHGLLYRRIYKTNQDPPKYGFTGGWTPCCIIKESGQCLPDQMPCNDRDKHLYWDAFHQTQEPNFRIASDCFFRSSSCVPINIKQLATL